MSLSSIALTVVSTADPGTIKSQRTVWPSFHDLLHHDKATEWLQSAAIKIVDYMMTIYAHAQAEFGTEGVQWLRPVEGNLALDSESRHSTTCCPPILQLLPQRTAAERLLLWPIADVALGRAEGARATGSLAKAA